MRLLTATFLLGIMTAIPTLSAAGEITKPDPRSNYQWKSTKCAKPVPPVAKTGTTKQDRLLVYARKIEIYIDCMQREAQQDFQDAQMALQSDIERELQIQTKVMNDMMLQASKTMR